MHTAMPGVFAILTRIPRSVRRGLRWLRAHPQTVFLIMQFFTKNRIYTPKFGYKIAIFLRFALPPPPSRWNTWYSHPAHIFENLCTGLIQCTCIKIRLSGNRPPQNRCTRVYLVIARPDLAASTCDRTLWCQNADFYVVCPIIALLA